MVSHLCPNEILAHIFPYKQTLDLDLEHLNCIGLKHKPI